MYNQKAEDKLLKYVESVEKQRKEKLQWNSRNEGAFLLFNVAVQVFYWILTFFFAFLYTVLAYLVPLAIIVSLLIVSITLRVSADDIRSAIDENNESKIEQIVKVTAGLYITYNILVSILQIAVSMFNITIRLVLILAMLGYQVVRALFLAVVVPFGDVLIEGVLFLVELATMLISALGDFFSQSGGFGSSASEDIGEGFRGGLFDQFTPDDPEFGSEANIFAQAIRGIIRFWQVIIKGIVPFIVKLGPRLLVFGDFIISIVIKYLPTFVDILTTIVDLISTDGGLGAFILAGAYVMYGLQVSIYGLCSQTQNTIGQICSITTWINKAVKQLKKAGIPLSKLPECNANNINLSCGNKPKKPDFGDDFGAGLCDEAQCVQDTLNIIQDLEMHLPFCSDWVANGNSSISCMNIVHQYSIQNSTSIAPAPIDTISKELCFVLTAVILVQCQNSLPPFGFPAESIANDICVLDKSGLSPPLATFNAGCACQFVTPLCDDGCCNQYALHTIGQIKSQIGGFQCGTILSQYPDDFWCQYESLDSAQVPDNSDLTFASAWCAAYQMVIKPACQFSSPLSTLNSLNIAILTDDYTAAFCNSTINQTGVCIPIRAEFDPDFIQFDFEQSLMELGMLQVEIINERENGFNGAPIDVIPVLYDDIDTIVIKDAKSHYCFYALALFNFSNPAFQASSASGGASSVVFAYCIKVMRETFASFVFDDVLGAKLRTNEGDPIPIELMGIPSNVVVFGSIPGTTPTNEDVLDCGFATGNSVLELADQAACVNQVNGQTLGDTSEFESSGTETVSGLQQVNATFVPISHLSSLTTSAPLDPSDPDYEQKVIDQNTMAAAKEQPTDWHSVPASQQTDQTSNYMRVYTYGATIDDTEFVQRNLLSIEQEQMKENFGFMHDLQQQIRKFNDKIDVLMAPAGADASSNSKKFNNNMRKYSRKGAFLLKRILNITKQELRDLRGLGADSPSFPIMRKLTSVTDPAINQTINNFWDTVSRVHSESGAARASSDAYSDEAAKNINYLTKTGWNTGYALFNFFYKLNYTSSDFGFGSNINPDVDYSFNAQNSEDYSQFGSGSTVTLENIESCRNSQEEPLKCCIAGATSYQCCRGYPDVCIKEIPSWFYATVTTRENVADQWYCEPFYGYFDYMKNLIKCITTVFFRALSLVAGSRSDFAEALSFMTYPDLKTPPNWLGCLILNSIWLWTTFLAFFLLFILFSVDRSAMIYMMIQTKSEDDQKWSEMEIIRSESKANNKETNKQV